LREGGRSSSLVARDRVRQLLVAAEVALSLMLLVGAGLLSRSGIIRQGVEPGFTTTRVFSAWLALPPAQYESVESVRTAYDRILTEVRAVPGVESAAGITVIPMTGLSAQGNFIPDGRSDDPANSISFNFRVATPGVFRTLRIPSSRRDFDDRDVAGTPCVIIVNEAGAKKAWPNERDRQADSRAARCRRARTMCSVIGVVGDAHDDGLREAVRPQIYFAGRRPRRRSGMRCGGRCSSSRAPRRPARDDQAAPGGGRRVDPTLRCSTSGPWTAHLGIAVPEVQHDAAHDAGRDQAAARGGRDLWSSRIRDAADWRVGLRMAHGRPGTGAAAGGRRDAAVISGSWWV
jgi:hypothetical protein